MMQMYIGKNGHTNHLLVDSMMPNRPYKMLKPFAVIGLDSTQVR